MHLGGPAQVLGGLVEVARGEVEPAGHLAQAQAEAVLGAVQPGIEGVGTADVRGGVAAAGQGDAAVDGQDGALIRPLVLQRRLPSAGGAEGGKAACAASRRSWTAAW